MGSLQHPAHVHALKFHEFSREFCSAEGGEPCLLCSRKIRGPTFWCEECGIFLHQSCAQVPDPLLHPCDLHPLSLVEARDTKCSFCQEDRTFLFHCKKCNMHIDTACVRALWVDDVESCTTSVDIFGKVVHVLSFQMGMEHNVICCCCGLPLSGEVYVACGYAFAVHKACFNFDATLSQKEKPHHPLHPQHSLVLAFITNKQCYFCSRDSSAYLTCRECNFLLHILCASTTLNWDVRGDGNTSYITHNVHEHELRSFHVKTETGIQCRACGHKMSNKFYGCLDCCFFIEESCLKLPQKIVGYDLLRHCFMEGSSPESQVRCSYCEDLKEREEDCYYCRKKFKDLGLDFLEETVTDELLQARFLEGSCSDSMPLCRFRLDLNDQRSEFVCRSCCRKYRSFYYYRVEDLEFRLDTTCALQILMCLEENVTPRIRHFSLKHEMYLSPAHKEDRCHVCKQSCEHEKAAYRCPVSKVSMHKSCVGSSPIQHPFHPEHVLFPVTHESERQLQCSVCLGGPEDFTYSCTACDFHLDGRCAFARKPFVKHALHEHVLTYFNKSKGQRCSSCGESCNYDLFRCFPCNFSLHHGCLPQPFTIERPSDLDPLTPRDMNVHLNRLEDGTEASTLQLLNPL